MKRGFATPVLLLLISLGLVVIFGWKLSNNYKADLKYKDGEITQLKEQIDALKTDASNKRSDNLNELDRGEKVEFITRSDVIKNSYPLTCIKVDEKAGAKYDWFNKLKNQLAQDEVIDRICMTKVIGGADVAVFFAQKAQQNGTRELKLYEYTIWSDRLQLERKSKINANENCGNIVAWTRDGNYIYYECQDKETIISDPLEGQSTPKVTTYRISIY